jgi:PHD/YefM family antitoxin component YafN of YafNO toxin-antitoxin module
MPLSEYNSLKEMEYITSSPAMVERLKEAKKEMREGKGAVISTEDLWK